MTNRLNSIEARIAAGFVLVAAVLKYTALGTVVDLPASLQGFPQYLSTITLVVLVFAMVLMGRYLNALATPISVALILTMLAVGGYFAFRFVDHINAHAPYVECVDDPRHRILVPRQPEPELARQIEIGGGVADGWCDHPDTGQFRALIASAANADVPMLTLWQIVLETMLTMSLIYAAWLLAPDRPAGASPRR